MIRPMGLQRRAFWAVLFVLAMAAAEGAVVVYLRELFCPQAALFPVQDFGPDPRSLRIGLVEVFREAATLAMLVAVAVLAGATRWQRWSFFMLAFGLWDLLYYFWLIVFLGWPPSPMTWDVLFLIPVVWSGPVLAPCLVSASLVGAAWVLLAYEEGVTPAFRSLDWILEVVAGLTIILSFSANAGACFHCGEAELSFPWLPFSTALSLGLSVFVGAVRRGLSRR